MPNIKKKVTMLLVAALLIDEEEAKCACRSTNNAYIDCFDNYLGGMWYSCGTATLAILTQSFVFGCINS